MLKVQVRPLQMLSKFVRMALCKVYKGSVEDVVLSAACSSVLKYYRSNELPLAPKSVIPDVLRVAGAYGHNPGKCSVDFVKSYIASVG